ncbi:dockerin type I domain-containing protein [Gorillibacterium sp. sgz500922]|uniref:dockerin type I domain-containing protein n=1 Tax=Gorillibacterium sp. sgz500922 TaxID=3446694 RepID=UPI003F67F283
MMAVLLTLGTLSSSAWLPDKAKAAGTGSGTEADPYIITTAAQLDDVRNQYDAVYYKLGADIDLSGYDNWVPIGDQSFPFKSYFDGNGYTITGLTVNRPASSYAGLFGYLSGGQVQNVRLSDVNVVGKDYVGGLVGFLSSGSGRAEYNTVSGQVSGNSNIGGLAGGTDSSSYINGNSANVAVNGNMNVGGLIGFYGGNLTMTDNSASGNVTGTGNNVGGLIGSTYGSAGTLSNSHASGIVTGKSSASTNLGGLVGNSAFSKIEYSYATGDVNSTGGTYLGGLVGFGLSTALEKSFATGNITVTGTANPFAGGLISRTNSNITNCYARGNVTAIGASTSYLGGLVGSHNGYIQYSYSVGSVTGKGSLNASLAGGGGTITDSYYNRDTAAQSVGQSSRGTAKTTAELKRAATFSLFNFKEVWFIKEGVDYPELLYPVAYDHNGGTGKLPAAVAYYQPGSTVSVLGNTGNLTRYGYIYAGWSTNPSGVGTVYKAGDLYTTDLQSVKFYAKWLLKTYRIAPLDNLAFPDLFEKYVAGTQEMKTVTVTRTGTEDLTHLTVRLSGRNADAFEIAGPAATTLNTAAPSATFTVKAKNGLPKGNYTATVTVTADLMADVTFTVEQAINVKPIIKGDATGDGKVTVADSLLITKYMQGKVTLTPEQFEALDMNGDGRLTKEDADMVQALYVIKN